MKYELNGREVEIEDINFEPGEGGYVQAATFVDTDVELTDDEIEQLQDKYADALYEEGLMNAVGEAEDWADARGDR